MPFSMSSLVPSTEGVAAFGGTILWGTIAIVIVTTIIVLIRNKIKYQYYAEVYKKRQSNSETFLPSAKIIKGKAGYFGKGIKTIFRIKYGMAPWQKIELTKLPDPTFMVDNKVTYVQLNKDNYAQAKMTINWDTEELTLVPVEDDLKYGAKLDILEKDAVLKTKSNLEKVAPYIVLGLIIMAGIIVMYFIQKGCG